MSYLIEQYFDNIKLPFLFRSKKIQILYNGKDIRNDKYVTLGQSFPQESEVIIYVNDPYNLFLINWNQVISITFQVNNSYKMKCNFSLTEELSNCLKSFLKTIDHDDLINNKDDIQYFYNLQPIQLFQTMEFREIEKLNVIGEFFLNDNNPIIFIRDLKNLIKPINVTFKTGNGNEFKTFINDKKTVEHLLIKFLDEIYHSELVDRNDKIQFLYRAQKIKFGDKTSIAEYFKNDYNPVIVVLDVNSYLSNNNIKKVNVIFKHTTGKENNVVVNYGTSVEQLIKIYCYKVCGIEPIENYCKNHIYLFTYSDSKINFREQALVEKYFNRVTVHVKVFDK